MILMAHFKEMYLKHARNYLFLSIKVIKKYLHCLGRFSLQTESYLKPAKKY
jgi:hypothetical protein